MASIGVKLPINKSSTDGFGMIKSISGMIKQNFKMLILTVPGERIMEPNFGVGLSQFLFEPFGQGTQMKIETRLNKQVSIYLPVVQIVSVNFASSHDGGLLALEILYTVPKIGTRDLLRITI